ncbi:hypothetical protein NL676_011392 [Syzygium grande]|nr:hypothetical protein NL676_011392 [Syzygium grande]
MIVASRFFHPRRCSHNRLLCCHAARVSVTQAISAVDEPLPRGERALRGRRDLNRSGPAIFPPTRSSGSFPTETSVQGRQSSPQPLVVAIRGPRRWVGRWWRSPGDGYG